MAAATAPKTMPSSVFAAALLLLAAAACQASPYYPLELGYYRYTCPQAEAIVKASMEKAIAQNPGNGAAVIRMLFHDCFVEVFTLFYMSQSVSVPPVYTTRTQAVLLSLYRAATLPCFSTRPRSARRRRSWPRPTTRACAVSS
jgi:hypothetical protein